MGRLWHIYCCFGHGQEGEIGIESLATETKQVSSICEALCNMVFGFYKTTGLDPGAGTSIQVKSDWTRTKVSAVQMIGVP